MAKEIKGAVVDKAIMIIVRPVKVVPSEVEASVGELVVEDEVKSSGKWSHWWGG